MENMEYQSVEEQLDERVIEIARVSKTVKGGRRLRYRVTVVVGDNNGMIGMGSGKANAVPDAMRKASDTARKNMKKVNLYKTTIPHEVCCNSEVCRKSWHKFRADGQHEESRQHRIFCILLSAVFRSEISFQT